jgi:plastocyanin domain-containing protein
MQSHTALLFSILLGMLLLTPAVHAQETPRPAVRTIAISVTDKGFEPGRVTVKKGVPLKLVVTRKTDATCATEVVVDGVEGKTKLPLNAAVSVSFTPKKSGELKYGCGMDKMVGGVLWVE